MQINLERGISDNSDFLYAGCEFSRLEYIIFFFLFLTFNLKVIIMLDRYIINLQCNFN